MAKANRNSLTEFVERELRQSILMGKFPPGTRLNIRELSELLGTSVTPIREALMRLSAQRILEARPGQFCIPVISRTRYVEISSIRLVVETMAAEQAAMRISAKQLAVVDTLAQEYISAIRGQNYQLAVALNAQFKFATFKGSGMPTLTAIIEDLMLQVAPLFIHTITPLNAAPDTWVPINVHYTTQIVQGLRERNPELASHAIKGLIMTATSRVLPALPE